MIGGVDIRDDQDWLNKLSNESDSGDLKIDLLFSKYQVECHQEESLTLKIKKAS
jgi:hypothetical protein